MVEKKEIDPVKVLDEVISLEYKEAEKLRADKPVHSWHPSSFGSCLCGRYLERIGAKKDKEFDDRTLRVFGMGNLLEKYITDKFIKNARYQVSCQVRVEDKDLGVSGYADVVLKSTQEDTEESAVVLELKSKNSTAFWKYLPLHGAQLNHKMQLWFYLWNLKIEKGFILYISKDDSSIYKFPVLRTDETLKKLVFDEIKILNYCLKHKIAPPCAKSGTWQASYCNFHKQCKQLQKEGKMLSEEQIKQILNN